MADAITPPAAPSPCGGGGSERTTRPVESMWYGCANCSASAAGNGRLRNMRAECVMPAGRSTSESTSSEKPTPAASAMARDIHE